MLLAAIGDTGYDLLLLLHLLAVVAAFGPLFLLPSLRSAAPDAAARLYLRLVLPALVVVWVAGMGLVGMSEDAFELTHLWIALSLVIWVVLVGLGVFVIRPGIREGRASSSRVAMATGVSHLLLVVALYLMVFKPRG